MKLNNQLREEIMERATDKLQNKFLKLKKETLECIEVSSILSAIGSKEQRELMNSLPSGWMKTESRFIFDAPRYEAREYQIDGNGKIKSISVEPCRDLAVYKSKDLIRVPYGMGSYGFKMGEDHRKKFLATVEAYNNWQKTRCDVYTNLKQYNTVEELNAAWPEGAKFTKNLTIATSTTALAVRWEDVNKKISS